MEIWKDIDGYEGFYQVSNLGKVRSLDRYARNGRFFEGKTLSSCDNGCGYLVVNLQVDGKNKMHTVHRLVAKAFIPNEHNLPQVNHKDGDKSNNNIDNLEWCNNSMNMKHAYKIGLVERPFGRKQRSKEIICVETGVHYIDSIEAGKAIKRNSSSIRECCRGERKTCGGYHWRYA